MDRAAAERAFEHPALGDGTLPRMFEASAARRPEGVAQRYKGGVYDRSLTADGVVPAAPDGAFAPLSYDRMRRVVRRLAAGFREFGVAPGDRVALFADTRMEWAQTDFAVLAAGGAVTTVYSSATDDQLRHLLSDSGAVGVVAEDAAAVEQVLGVAEAVPVSFVVSMDRLEADYADAAAEVVTLAELYRRGEAAYDPDAYESWLDERDPAALASLIYTSGTTGRPKGVALTHRNFRANVNQCFRRFGPRPDREDAPIIDEDATLLSFLPLAHVFERLAGHFLIFAAGATVAYAESPETLRSEFGAVSPSVGTSVPRVYERLYDAAREEAGESGPRRRLFEWAVDVGRDRAAADDPGLALRAKAAVADRLVFSSVREALGGDIDLFISGGGSLSPELCALYHGMGLPVFEGYGLSETAPVVAVNPPESPAVGTVGPPVDGVDVELDGAAASPEQRAATDDEVGELLVRGPNVFDGYWNLPAATERAFVPADDGGDPWFRTGDVVARRDDGYIRFLERAKQLLTLSTGKNVAPGPLEDAFAARPLVEQCMVVGDGRRFVGALVVPNVGAVRRWGERAGHDLPADREALCADDRVRRRVGEVVEEVNEGFERYERIKRFRLVPDPFTEANGLLTPTMKKKRGEILDRHGTAVADLYGES
jgi:long-chain acyl-CoA synthetase